MNWLRGFHAQHSLNLVVSSAAECCLVAVNLFGLMQSVYNFLSASLQRWAKLLDNMQKKVHVLQSLPKTRWSARSDACRAIVDNYSEAQKTLIDIAESGRQPPSAANEAKALAKKLNQFETAIMCVVWNDILQKTNVTFTILKYQEFCFN